MGCCGLYAGLYDWARVYNWGLLSRMCYGWYDSNDLSVARDTLPDLC